MIDNDTTNVRKIYALSLSIGLHIMLLVFFNFYSIRTCCVPHAMSYQITLHHTQQDQIDTQPATKNKPLIKQPKKKIPKNKTGTTQKGVAPIKKVRPLPPPKNPNKGKRVQKRTEKVVIDQRGLHTGNKKENKKKRGGLLLDLVGWIWDTTPKPQDTTEETGKIVFEIKVDAFGEIIAIKTLEKTVTPLVEQIYTDSLTGLTFSKTSDSHAYAPISTGRVTFIIQTK